eukprot:10373064-Prorocentrum_lima.AAC.1
MGGSNSPATELGSNTTCQSACIAQAHLEYPPSTGGIANTTPLQIPDAIRCHISLDGNEQH